ncbi:MAG: type II CAAX endopeptidase family protein [Novosphingobium sp.]
MAQERSAAAGWLTIGLGLFLALALVRTGQFVAPRIAVEAVWAQITAFYLALFAPLIVLALALGLAERRRVLRAGERPALWLALGLASGVGGLALCVGYVWLHGGLRPAPLLPPPAAAMLALGLAITAMQVAAEELLFRGWLLAALAERTGAWGGVVLSALAFSAFHLVGGIEQPYSLVNLLLGGVWFALLALRSGGLLAPFAAHYGWNVTEDLGLGLVPNPGQGSFGALWDHDIAGPALWGGSIEGLNPTLAMTVVLLALILPLLSRPLLSRPLPR